MRHGCHRAGWRPVLGLGAALVAGSAAAQVPAPYPEVADPRLQAGREVWLGTCRECHANLLSDAPQVKSRKAWEARLAKPRSVLYQHALEGFSGPSGTEMPPRGGNARLSDEQVRAAVDYLITLIQP